MTVAVHPLISRSLRPEWERIELLARCLMQAREGVDIDEETLNRLKHLQHQIDQLRTSQGPWQTIDISGLNGLELDVLAAVLAVEAEPRFAMIYQTLQAGIPQPYATPALLQELFALAAEEVDGLFAVLSRDGHLRHRGLIRMSESGPFAPIRPGAGITARLLGRPGETEAPPGAIRIKETAGWNDLILPDNRLRMLREFLLWITHRHRVVDEWGGKDTGGPIALFSGPSGTGKTFAAIILATALDWPLYRVDLGRLVSKYIGETEKNLNRLFDAAHNQRMVLQFDEADSLMGKRGEVKEARDRYANMEVSHLLARIESHHGPCILTTNLRDHLDSAFSRRFQMVVEFPRPDAEARGRLWDRLLPPKAPRDREVDVRLIGEWVNMTGGSIKNAALHAAFLAAEAGSPINLKHIAVAAWRELAKDGRPVSDKEMGPLMSYLPPGIQSVDKPGNNRKRRTI